MKSEALRKYLITLICCVLAIAVSLGIHFAVYKGDTEKTIKVGFIYVGDTSDAYTNNFVKAESEIEKLFEERVVTVAKYNVPEDSVEPVIMDLVEENCDLIFSTSYGYVKMIKKYAEKYPNI